MHPPHAFVVYTVCTLILTVNLLGLWVYSGVVRGKVKVTPNAEDAGNLIKGASLAERDPPEIARVLRAHANAMANIVPFLATGLLYVMWGAGTTAAWVLFGGFTFFRVVHSFAYVAGKQPWRTLSFSAAGLAQLGVLVQLVRHLVAHHG